jgi:AcrR family transcriptional regulator
MAQWKYGPFDVAWDEQVQSSLRLLRKAADRWLLDGVEPEDVHQILANLVQGLAAKPTEFEFKCYRVPARCLPDLLDDCTIPLQTQIERLLGTRKRASAAAIAEELRASLESAAQSWIVHGAQTPPTGQILLQLISLLFHHGIVRRPPPPTLDE